MYKKIKVTICLDFLTFVIIKIWNKANILATPIYLQNKHVWVYSFRVDLDLIWIGLPYMEALTFGSKFLKIYKLNFN